MVGLKIDRYDSRCTLCWEEEANKTSLKKPIMIWLQKDILLMTS